MNHACCALKIIVGWFGWSFKTNRIVKGVENDE